MSLKPGTRVTQDATGRATARSESRQLDLGVVAVGTLKVLETLTKECLTIEQLVALAQSQSACNLGELLHCVMRLSEAGLIAQVMTHQGKSFAVLMPHCPGFDYDQSRLGDADCIRASRFLTLTHSDQGLQVEAALAPALVALHDWRATAILHALMDAQSLRGAKQQLEGVASQLIEDLASLLVSAGLFELPDREAEATSAASGQFWHPADLNFHVHSRRGHRDAAFGATFPGQKSGPALPVVKPAMSEKSIVLFAPETDDLMTNDPPFSQVLETRCSHRSFGPQPLSVAELGEFLFRVARLRSLDQADERAYQTSSRPYPSGGACHELEFYLVVRTCRGLKPGLYHYRPDQHTLSHVQEQNALVDRLLQDAQRSSGAEEPPQVLVLLAARFGRVMWKYEGLGYALILKHVGVAMQTMYLAATAMGLAGCALGGGDGSLFARLTGLDPRDEASVGEFMLGSRAEPPIAGEMPC